MTLLTVLLHLSTFDALALLSQIVPNPEPRDPTDGSDGISLLVSFVKWGVLISCAIVALVSGGLLAAGTLSNRPDQVDKGKKALVWSLGGVIVGAIAIPVVNSVFSAAS